MYSFIKIEFYYSLYLELNCILIKWLILSLKHRVSSQTQLILNINKHESNGIE